MQCIAMSRRRLTLECIDLYYLHRIDAKASLDEQMGVLAEASAGGSIRLIGLCRVTAEQLRQARQIAPIAAVQNRYSHQPPRRGHEGHRLLRRNDIALVPLLIPGTADLAHLEENCRLTVIPD